MDASGDGSDLGDGPPTLPPRLFASGSYPSGARLTIYSKANVIGSLFSILKGTDAMKTILNSQFGKLFRLPVARCANSAKLIHGLLTRQLVTGKKHQIWSVFGGKPIKFSLREFHIISGLRCSQMPTAAELEEKTAGAKEYWKYLFPPPYSAAPTVKSVLDTLRDPLTDARKVLPLALLVIVDGIVYPNKKLKITEEFVGLVQDIDYFLSFPWGRKSFTKTFSRFGPGYTSTESLVQRFRQTNNACYGFPLPLQLMAFECIPLLKDKIPNSLDMSSFTDNPTGCNSPATLLNEEDIAAVEADPQLVVHPILVSPKELELDEDDFLWDDEEDDPKVETLETLIKAGHGFSSKEFVGGVPAADRLEPRRVAKQEGPLSNEEPKARRPAVKHKAKSTAPSLNPSPQKKSKTEGNLNQARVTRSQTKKVSEKRTKTLHFKQQQPGFQGESSTGVPAVGTSGFQGESSTGVPAVGTSEIAAIIAELKRWSQEREDIKKAEIFKDLIVEMDKRYVPKSHTRGESPKPSSSPSPLTKKVKRSGPHPDEDKSDKAASSSTAGPSVIAAIIAELKRWSEEREDIQKAEIFKELIVEMDKRYVPKSPKPSSPPPTKKVKRVRPLPDEDKSDKAASSPSSEPQEGTGKEQEGTVDDEIGVTSSLFDNAAFTNSGWEGYGVAKDVITDLSSPSRGITEDDSVKQFPSHISDKDEDTEKHASPSPHKNQDPYPNPNNRNTQGEDGVAGSLTVNLGSPSTHKDDDAATKPPIPVIHEKDGAGDDNSDDAATKPPIPVIQEQDGPGDDKKDDPDTQPPIPVVIQEKVINSPLPLHSQADVGSQNSITVDGIAPPEAAIVSESQQVVMDSQPTQHVVEDGAGEAKNDDAATKPPITVIQEEDEDGCLVTLKSSRKPASPSPHMNQDPDPNPNNPGTQEEDEAGVSTKSAFIKPDIQDKVLEEVGGISILKPAAPTSPKNQDSDTNPANPATQDKDDMEVTSSQFDIPSFTDSRWDDYGVAKNVISDLTLDDEAGGSLTVNPASPSTQDKDGAGASHAVTSPYLDKNEDARSNLPIPDIQEKVDVGDPSTLNVGDQYPPRSPSPCTPTHEDASLSSPDSDLWDFALLTSSYRQLRETPLPCMQWVSLVKSEFEWECSIYGPEGSPYEGGVFVLSLSFPQEFPRMPPVLKFKTPIHHPNVSKAGKVLLKSLRHAGWNPAMSVADIIETVWGMMAKPSLEDPESVVEAIRKEYLHNNEVFVRIARTMTDNQ